MLLIENTQESKKKRTWRAGKPLKTTSQFIDDAIRIHGNKYDYDKVIYVNKNTRVIITCRTHGDFEQVANNHLQGDGCAKCARNKKKTTRSFIEAAMLIHGDTYIYDKVEYVNKDSKVTITCRVHGDFEQRPGSHLRGAGCAKCTKRISKQELEWLKSLNLSSLIYQYRIRSSDKWSFVDAYDPDTNTIYLYHGDYWHGNINRYDRSVMNTRSNKTMGVLYDETMEYERVIRSLGYNLITMWESEWNVVRKQLLDVNQTV